MSERDVGVYRESSGRILVETLSYTTEGALVMDGAPRTAAPEATAGEIGRLIVEGLNRSHHDMPPRNTIVRPDADFLAFIGLPSWGKFMPGVRSVGVCSNYDDAESMTEAELTPKNNEGPRGGFTPIIELIRTVPYESPEHLGQAVLDALEQATA